MPQLLTYFQIQTSRARANAQKLPWLLCHNRYTGRNTVWVDGSGRLQAAVRAPMPRADAMHRRRWPGSPMPRPGSRTSPAGATAPRHRIAAAAHPHIRIRASVSDGQRLATGHLHPASQRIPGPPPSRPAHWATGLAEPTEWMGSHAGRQTDGQTGRQTDRQTDGQASNQIDRRSGRAGRQSEQTVSTRLDEPPAYLQSLWGSFPTVSTRMVRCHAYLQSVYRRIRPAPSGLSRNCWRYCCFCGWWFVVEVLGE